MDNMIDLAKKTKPFELVFECGHYAVWQCRDEKHAALRAKDTYPKKVLKTVKPA